MNAREFVAVVKHHAADSAADDAIRGLAAPLEPPSPPAAEESESGRGVSEFVYRAELLKYQRSVWFQSLNRVDRDEISELLRECAEAAVANFFCVLDGVAGDTPGGFEVVEVERGQRRVLNTENSEMLHDLFSEICEAERHS